MMPTPTQTFQGMPVVISDKASEPTGELDWSRCRSLGRAMRRHKQGHRQNIVELRRPLILKYSGHLYIHPIKWAELQREMEKENHGTQRQNRVHYL